MITPDGWFDWAERIEPKVKNVNGYHNAGYGLFMHSAEGYESTLLNPNSSYGYNGDLSWHATNCLSGRFVQHYPLTAQCWHATAANNEYQGFENEGVYTKEKSLTEAQIANAVRAILDLQAWYGWSPSRPKSNIDTGFTLWEHNEVVRLGGDGTQCPSGRIPWDEIMRRLKPEEDDEVMHLWSGDANPAYWNGRTVIGNHGWGIRADFGLPAEAKSVEVEVYLKSGALALVHGGTQDHRAGVVRGATINHFRIYMDAAGSAWMRGDNAVIEKLSALGYYSS